MNKIQQHAIGRVNYVLNIMLVAAAIIVLPISARSHTSHDNALTAIGYEIQTSVGILSDDQQRTQQLDTELLQALSSNDIRLVMQLITRGADVDLRVPDAYKPAEKLLRLMPDSFVEEIKSSKPPTLVMYAIAHKQGKLVDLLLKRGAAVNLTGSYLLGGPQDYDEHRELMKVSRYARKHHIKRLFWDADIPSFCWYTDITPLHLAIYQQNPFLVARLIRCGANVNAEASGGETALQLAAKKSSFAIVKLLVRHGALIDAQDREGDTALKLAANCGEKQIYDYLKRAGATGEYTLRSKGAIQP